MLKVNRFSSRLVFKKPFFSPSFNWMNKLSFPSFICNSFQLNVARDCIAKKPFTTTNKPGTNPQLNLVKELRKLTSAGYGDCKEALEASGNNIQKAIEWLKEKGKATITKKVQNITAEGFICLSRSEKKDVGLLLEMNSETDFVSRTPIFTTLLRTISDSILKSIDSSTVKQEDLKVEEIKGLPLNTGETIHSSITDAITRLQENISLRRGTFFVIPAGKGVVGAYVHQTSGVPHGLGVTGALVAVLTDKPVQDSSKLSSLADQLAIHVVGMSPLYLTKKEVPADYIQKFVTQRKQQGERADHNSVISEVVLMEQEFVLDNSKTVSQVIKEFSNELEVKIEVKGFLKYICGEGLEKKRSDLAKDVSQMLKK